MPYEKERESVCVCARTALSDIMSSLLSLCLMIDVRAEREKRLSVESALGFARDPERGVHCSRALWRSRPSPHSFVS